MAEGTADDGGEQWRERRRERERRARARRRRARLRGAVLLAAIIGAGAGAAIAESGGGSPAHARGPTRLTISVRVAPVGALPGDVQDAAAVADGSGGALLLGGIGANQASTAQAVVVRGRRSALAGALPGPQHDAEAARLGGSVYVFGGGVVASYDHIVEFDPRTGTGRVVARLPRPQSDVAVTTIGGTAYIVGGYDGVAPLDTILAWRPGEQARVVARMPYGLRYAAVAAVGGVLVIAGGTEADGSVSDAILTYDPRNRGAVVETGVLPRAVTHASAAVVGGRIYLIGGRRSASGEQTASVVAIDAAGSSASTVGRLPGAVSDAAAVAIGDQILVAGGQSRSGAPVRAVVAVTPVARLVAVHRVSPAAVRREAFRALASRGFAQTLLAHPASIGPYEAAALRPGLPGYLLIADRGNNRILVVNPAGKLVWSYPDAADLAAGRRLHFNDDTFVEPGGRSLIANEEDYGDVVSVDIRSHRLTVLFGTPGVLGGGATQLNYPDDAYELANDTFTVADAYNCRILFVRAHAIVRQYGRSGVCAHDPPHTFGAVNGDTPTPAGGVLVSEIPGHWVDEITASGALRWTVQAPVGYPSDPQPLANDDVLLADYSLPGHVVVMNSRGDVLWRYGPAAPAEAELNHPSLALELPNGDIAVNDDYRNRVVVIDPRSDRIVWQYGHTDRSGTAPGYLRIPDGMDFIPAGPGGGIDWAATVHP